MFTREIGWRSPIAAAAPLAGEPFSFILHGGDCSATRWSFLSAFPAEVIRADQAGVWRNGSRIAEEDPFAAIARVSAERRTPLRRSAVPLGAGIVGFAGYELGGIREPHAKGPPSPFALPDLCFGAYDAVAAFDRIARRAFISGRTAVAVDRLECALGTGNAPAPAPQPRFSVQMNFDSSAYKEAVKRVIQRIGEGAFFQANLSRRIFVSPAPDPFLLFNRLSAGDASHLSLLNFPEGAIVSNSPERFFNFDPCSRRIVCEPIKGTRPRGRTTEEDRLMTEELLSDPKDRAENVMIADLVRNDLSRICMDESISEDAICELLSGARVHHLVSRISGILRPDLQAVDALAAMFPCGSVTGAPKIEAMRAIAAEEGEGRGPYCGAIGYVDDSGGADFSVAIRTMTIGGGRGVFQVGGGVTLRSDPEAEHWETLAKAEAMLAALDISSSALSSDRAA